jgi:hypothetical protein
LTTAAAELHELTTGQAAAYRNLTRPRPASEYHEDMGPVLWWRLEKYIHRDRKTDDAIHMARWAGEPPYVGTPNDLPTEISIESVAVKLHCLGESTLVVRDNDKPPPSRNCIRVGGFPSDYYTHFTPIPVPELPKA